jgi:hypothetical protein
MKGGMVDAFICPGRPEIGGAPDTAASFLRKEKN